MEAESRLNAPAGMTDEELLRRLARLKDGGRPTLIDLFSGCGGMTLGFHRAGFHPLAGVELDKHAARSHALNFHADLQAAEPARFDTIAAARDITKIDPATLLRDLGHAEDTTVDVIVGGPPCPAFTRVGRAKLRQVRKREFAFREDPRWQLYRPYLDFVRTLRPLALVMENVPDVMNFGGQNVAEDIARLLESMGYRAAYSLLNAAHYGVPQMRDRFILIAFDDRLGIEPTFPEPTHHIELPRGYQSSRHVAMRLLENTGADRQATLDLLEAEPTHFVEPRLPASDATPAITIGEALGDLPDRVPGPRGARRLNELVAYRRQHPPSAYAQEMRSWPGFGAKKAVTAHVTRALKERDFRIFERMRPGDDYPAAHAIAMKLFEAELGRRPSLSPDARATLKSEYVPPYDPGKFPNKWRKMDPRKPARTLMAHLGKDSYTHIHYDSAQRRVLTVREAARLQSFPDGFQFSGTMNPGFRQIGNAVPPLLAFAIAKTLKAALTDALSTLLDQPQA